MSVVRPGVASPLTESADSAVSWAAIIAGALAAASITIILMLLGSGFGLSMVSPFGNSGASATSVAVSAAIWLVVVQWLSAAFGGYLAGRLRTRWSGIHADEVYFRDTAHGFMSWALATIVVFVLLSSALSSIIGGGVQAVSNVAAGAAQGGVQAAGQTAGQSSSSGGSNPASYFVDMLYRAPQPANGAAAAPSTPAGQAAGDYRGETLRILGEGAASGSISDPDKAYLAQMVSRQTGLSEADAKARVDQVLQQVDAAKQKAKEAADAARKAAASFSLLTALSLLIGAFVASVAAIIGGRQRDEVEGTFS